MLKQRVITALVLLALLLPALAASSAWPFSVLMIAMAAAASWEWGRLNQAMPSLSIVMGIATAVCCALALAAGWVRVGPSPVWWIASAAWVLGGGMALRVGPSGWPGVPRAIRWLIGLAALWTAWLAMSSAKAVGINFILSIFCVVWAADIAAYFGGRAFGKRKLAPAISPGKSWEGVYSGMLGVLLLAVAWMYCEMKWAGWTGAPMASLSLFSTLYLRLGWIGLVLALVFLAAVSVAGDLVESLVKRAAGAKDSSALLPGHGGVLDRVDALLPVFPVALALATLPSF